MNVNQIYGVIVFDTYVKIHADNYYTRHRQTYANILSLSLNNGKPSFTEDDFFTRMQKDAFLQKWKKKHRKNTHIKIKLMTVEKFLQKMLNVLYIVKNIGQ